MEIEKQHNLNVSDEFNKVIDYVYEEFVQMNPYTYPQMCDFMYAILVCDDCKANKVIILAEDEKTIRKGKELCEKIMLEFNGTSTRTKEIKKEDILTSPFINSVAHEFNNEINSVNVLNTILSKNASFRKLFGNTKRALSDSEEDKQQKQKEQNEKKFKNFFSEGLNNKSDEQEKKKDGAISHFMTNLTENYLDYDIVGRDNVCRTIFRTFAKRHGKNVLIVGEDCIGKTAILRHIGRLLAKKKCPSYFKDYQLVEFDRNKLVRNVEFGSSFESNLTRIENEAAKNGKYIICIDDLGEILDTQRIREAFITFASNEKIPFIATISELWYKKMMATEPSALNTFTIIKLEDVTEEKAREAIKERKEYFEIFHEVCFPDEVIDECINVCKKHFNNKPIIASVFEVLDNIGAKYITTDLEAPDTIKNLKEKLTKIKEEKQRLKLEPKIDYDKIDELTNEEITVKSLLKLETKTINLNREPKETNINDVYEVVSDLMNAEIKKSDCFDREKLKSLNAKLKEIVVGQDEAIDEVCRVVKRQQVGLSNNNKPSVFLFAGSTGIGKTYLAKQLAKHVFGDEKKFVRLDMSEYSDKMSSSKLIGSAAGYIGYEDGGILTEAIKKNKQCVLLLDECEKADEKIFDVFLQVFDEGRLTDNKGVTVSFKDVIIIMTSNVGAKEVSENKGGIGFNANENRESNERSIYEKAIKKCFKPEFINRIDKIVCFNKLTGDNLEKIIKLELDKVNEKLFEIGYSLDDSSYDPIVKKIMENISEQKEYGARPIIREIQRVVEDKITDIIIENNSIKKGHKFNSDEIVG